MNQDKLTSRTNDRKSADSNPSSVRDLNPESIQAPMDVAEAHNKSAKPARERSRSKSKERDPTITSESKKVMEEATAAIAKTETKEEKLERIKLAKERYLQRKQQAQETKTADPANP